MKKTVCLFILILGSFATHAQSKLIKNIFRLLPSSKVLNLSVGTRDSLLKGKTYYPVNNNESEIAAYNYGSSVHLENYMYISMSFETGQRGTAMIEIRCFKKSNGENLVVVSQTGGVWQVNYHQQGLWSFFYTTKKRLVACKKNPFPALDEKSFLKSETPDSIQELILNNSNLSFDFSGEKVMLGLNSPYLTDSESIRKWLRGDRVYYEWVNDHFVLNKIEF